MSKSILFYFYILPLFLIQQVKCHSYDHTTQEVDVISAIVNECYHLDVVNGNHTALQFLLPNSTFDFSSGEFRLELELVDKSVQYGNCPLIATLSQGKYVTSVDLPLEYKGDKETVYYYAWEKNVCIDPKESVSEDTGIVQVSLVLSTCHLKVIQFRLILRYITGELVLKLGEKKETYVAPSTARYYRFPKPSKDEKTIVVSMRSEDKNCMTVSIQSPSCPVFDDETNIRHMGYWQTFTTRTGITVESKDFPEGFFLVLVTNHEDSGCTNKEGYDSSGRDGTSRNSRKLNKDGFALIETEYISSCASKSLEREKHVFLSVKKALSPSQYVWPTFFPLVVYIPIIILTMIIYIVFHRRHFQHYAISNEVPDTKCFLRSEKYISDPSSRVDGSQRAKLEKKSKRYLYLLITIAIFYCIPVFQLIINYLSIVYRTGEQDICYYNNLCSLPLNKIMDFNHIYSNIGYVIFGILFFALTLARQRTMSNGQGLCGVLDPLTKKFDSGCFDHWGMYYALGFALFMEGFLSASYHICPNRANFQFDTSFMYAMAVLSYVKIYQFRHFIYMNELLMFLLLALVVACVVFGLFSTSLAYNILLSFIHLLLVIGLQFFLILTSRTPDRYEEEQFSVAWGIFLELCHLREPRYLRSHHPNKSLFWWTVFWNILLVINSWTLVYGSNFATQVLYILLANLALYIFYYFIMKFIHGEFSSILRNASLQSLIYGTISLAFWIPGMYYFVNPLSTWDVSPAESRELNGDCALLEFYDNHDIWHLLSAPALFFSFMMFLTIDDGMIGRHQESIPVF